jgi:hypothetical protein
MEGKFKTENGTEVKVLEYDEPNKILFALFPYGRRIWIGKTEYSKWKKISKEKPLEVNKTEHIYIPDIPAQMTEEKSEVISDEVESTLGEVQIVESEVVIKPKKRDTKKK